MEIIEKLTRVGEDLKQYIMVHYPEKNGKGKRNNIGQERDAATCKEHSTISNSESGLALIPCPLHCTLPALLLC